VHLQTRLLSLALESVPTATEKACSLVEIVPKVLLYVHVYNMLRLSELSTDYAA
jgi:hypothetical protein